MNRPRIAYETRSKRARRGLWLKIGVWVLVVLFAFSVAGGVVILGGFGR